MPGDRQEDSIVEARRRRSLSMELASDQALVLELVRVLGSTEKDPRISPRLSSSLPHRSRVSGELSVLVSITYSSQASYVPGHDY
jgi:hypothetical protein